MSALLGTQTVDEAARRQANIGVREHLILRDVA
jgi:hypothetical protein